MVVAGVALVAMVAWGWVGAPRLGLVAEWGGSKWVTTAGVPCGSRLREDLCEQLSDFAFAK